MENEITSLGSDQSEGLIERSLRPLTLDDFIGQNHIKENLRVFIDAARNRRSALDHVLLYGPPGLGKTSLAQIIAKELGVNFRTTSGPLLSKAADLAAIITNLQEGDILFIDEIHRLSAAVEEVLYSAMEDYKLDLVIGEGPSARNVSIDLAKFTLVGATTRLGLLTKPLRERFGIPLRLNFYEVSDLKLILAAAARKFNTSVEGDAAAEIAKRARGTPRLALRFLKRVIDFAQSHEEAYVSEERAKYALEKLEVDSYGLDANDYRYLIFIADKYDGGPVGVETIAAGLAEHKDALEETVEPYLIQRGFLQRTVRGRVLTTLALDYLKTIHD